MLRLPATISMGAQRPGTQNARPLRIPVQNLASNLCPAVPESAVTIR
jgi:hypothetical protein